MWWQRVSSLAIEMVLYHMPDAIKHLPLSLSLSLSLSHTHIYISILIFK